ncbi:MAG: hypothetical protein IPG78_12045 [Ignavibacteria bacterium]|nr:hypothetical protein [Ignavibacteria bacterium]
MVVILRGGWGIFFNGGEIKNIFLGGFFWGGVGGGGGGGWGFCFYKNRGVVGVCFFFFFLYFNKFVRELEEKKNYIGGIFLFFENKKYKNFDNFFFFD